MSRSALRSLTVIGRLIIACLSCSETGAMLSSLRISGCTFELESGAMTALLHEAGAHASLSHRGPVHLPDDRTTPILFLAPGHQHVCCLRKSAVAIAAVRAKQEPERPQPRS